MFFVSIVRRKRLKKIRTRFNIDDYIAKYRQFIPVDLFCDLIDFKAQGHNDVYILNNVVEDIQAKYDNAHNKHSVDAKITLTDEEIEDFVFEEIRNRVKEIEGKPKDEYEKIDDSFVEIACRVFKQREVILPQSQAAQIAEQLEAANIIYSGKISALCSNKEKLEENTTKAITEGLSIYKEDNDGNYSFKYYETKEQNDKRRYFNEHILPLKEGEIEESVMIEIERNVIIKEDRLKEKQKQEEDKLKEEVKQELLEEERRKNEKLKKRRLKEQLKAELKEQGLLSEEYLRKRESIPQDIQDRVWNRDGGKCVKCGSQEKIEFDHIIPFSRGGSNTYRNLQILCEKCNREKNNKIGIEN